ncbi:MAG TPA: hypothetical protein VLG76_05580 [Rhabdochlamydiaceae bacterium]|nr:hypothetical protein [Rhabdochlamydiaceae bacterium]
MASSVISRSAFYSEEPKDLFFRHHRPEVVAAIVLGHPSFPVAVAGVVADYITNKEDVFGAREWARVFGVDTVDPEKELPAKSFYHFWFRPDPLDAQKKVCETHLTPVLRPSVVKVPANKDTKASFDDYSLDTFGRLIQNPRQGHRTQYKDYFKLSAQHRTTSAGPPCWLIMRENVIARNKEYKAQKQEIKKVNAKTQIGYEMESSILDLATVVCVHYVCTKKRHLGDAFGTEGEETNARGKERVICDICAAGQSHEVAVGVFSEIFGLDIKPISTIASADAGVALMKKF